MNKIYTAAITALIILCIHQSKAATWERMYSMKSTDCFRKVREVPSGGFILAGYTANLTPHDTDALAVRLNDNGDTLWTFVYNGPNSKADAFYEVIPTADGGFAFCGYSASFGSGENAFYVKLNSNGAVEWVKNWGGSGIEHAEDIIQLSDGKYAIVGYTTSAPAHYYDAFILKIDQTGSTVWSKIYGGTNYDAANSLKELPDGGLIVGGQSNNQLYMIRTNSIGDSLWTKAFGTSGVENVECVNIAQGNDGFILAGTTDGLGAGGEDAYLVKTDSGGVQQWFKTYGGPLNEGFHQVEQTSDGGYVAIGTSSQGPWNNPNMWMAKLDVSGTLMWQNYYGGNNHDHGYTGQQTSDGGYIIAGHTHSFANNVNLEDALVIKTTATGQASTPLNYTTVTDLLSPVGTTCGSSNVQIQVQIANYGDQTITSIPVTVEITGAITQTLTQTYNSSVTRDQLKTLTFTTTVDMSLGGTFHFHCYTGNQHDVIPAHNFFDKTLIVGITSQPPVITDGTHCGPGTVSLAATSPDPVKWYTAMTGGTSLGTGYSFTTPYITSNTVYYAQAGQNCPSTRVAVNANISAGLAAPMIAGGSRCGSGTVNLSATSAYSVSWYNSATSTSSLGSNANFTTPSINSTTTYYVSAENVTCSSNRLAVIAVVNQLPSSPVTTSANICGSGSVVLNATASAPIKWFSTSAGTTQIGTGSSFTTPVITTTTTYYAIADDGTCMSPAIAATATIVPPPSSPVVTSMDRCGSGSVALSATSVDTMIWFDAPSNGNQVGTGSTFNTPVINSTTTFYVVADNGTCKSNRVSAIATINPIPVDAITSSSSICGSGAVVLTATASNSILWYDAASGGNQVGSGNSFTTPVITATTTYYAQTDNGQCAGNPVATTAIVNPLPVVNLGPDTVVSGASSYLLDAGAGFAGYLWTTSDVSQTYSVNTTGNYCVTVTDNNNCTATDCIYIELSVGIDEIQNRDFTLYPEPTNGQLTIELPSVRAQLRFSVLDITGKVVYKRTLNSQREHFDLSFLVKGIYLVRISDDNFSSTKRLVIE